MGCPAYLSSLEKFGINLGLDRITYLLEKLDNPHLKFKSIHIAGTNGKGSTAAMTASILKQAGYKVGLYTSPHLFDFTERIKINGKEISKNDFNTGINKIKQILSTNPPIHPTIFEVLTALAFWYFAKKKVDYAVVEVGMGGRLDATNVLTPEVSVITNIDYEHTNVLGKTLPKIAKEKAAIIKPGVPVVTAERKREALAVIRRVCREKKCLLREVSARQYAVSSKLLGKHQELNAACAISAIKLAGIKVDKAAIKRGLQKTYWPGRFQIVSKRPLIIVDGAHNPAGAKVVRVMIKGMFNKKFSVIYGCQQDKDYKKVLQQLMPVASQIIATRSSHGFAQQPETIAKYLKNGKVPVQIASSIREAGKLWDGQSALLITGSLFLVADVMKSLDAFERA